MKIKRVSTYVLRAPLGAQRFYSSQAAFPERNSLLIRIETDSGIVGWGEGGQYGPPDPVQAAIDRVIAPVLLGEDPMRPTVLWERLYAMTRDFGQKGTYVEALSAIDIALWDITGKALGVPAYTLLGGAFRSEVTAYATGCYYRGTDEFDSPETLQTLADEARSYVEDGFTILKLKVGLLPIAADLERLSRIRKAVGDNIILLVDANHAYNAASALRIGREMEALGIQLFEEPVVPEDLDGYRRVRDGLSMAISGGECEFTRFGFRTLIERGCVDIAQPDICAAGGLSEYVKIVAIASSHGVQVLPHVWGSAVGFAAALQALAITPWQPFTYAPVPLQNDPICEFDRNPNPLRDELVSPRIERQGNAVQIPDGPGLGINVDEAVVARFATETTDRTL